MADPTHRSAVAIRLFVHTAFFYLLQGKLAEAEDLTTIFKWNVDDENPPNNRLFFYSVYSFFCILAGKFKESIETANQAFEIEEKTGIRMMYPQGNGAAGALNLGDVELAEKLLKRICPYLGGSGNYFMAFYYAQMGWISFIKKDFLKAKEYSRKGIDASENAGARLLIPISYLQGAIALHLKNEKNLSEEYLDKALKLSREHKARQVEFGCHLARAEFALKEKNQDKLVHALRDGLRLGKENGYVNTHFWRPEIMSKLCVHALQNGIETDYVCDLIRKRRLWPIKIRTLGGFSLEIYGKRIEESKGKKKKIPISILYFILSKDGRNARVSELLESLWGEDEEKIPSNPTKAFNIGLYRLREIFIRYLDNDFGKEAVIDHGEKEGLLHLNKKICWLDIWELIEIESRLRKILAGNSSITHVEDLLGRLRDIYRGKFLQGENEKDYWILGARNHWEKKYDYLTSKFEDSLRHK